MRESIRFLHTGDVHLGRPVSSGGELPSHLEPLFKNAGFSSLEYIFERAMEWEVDFVLIAGDLHDREARSVRSSRKFQQACCRLMQAEIPIYLISGNHDPHPEKQEPFSLTDNVRIFSSEEVESFACGSQARILGQSYRTSRESRKMYSYYTVPDQSRLNLGLLHTQLDPENSRYVPISLKELKAKDDIHYWALGHIHEPRVLSADSPAVIFSGTPQGRSINEAGVKGCFLVEVPADNPREQLELKFLPTSSLIFTRLNLEIKPEDRINNITDLEKLLKIRAEELLGQSPLKGIDFPGADGVEIIEGSSPDGFSSQVFQGFIARWLITGEGPVHEIISESREETVRELKKSLNTYFAGSGRKPFLWTHSLQFNTTAGLPDLEDLKNSNRLYREIAEIIAELGRNEELEQELLEEWGRIWQADADPEEREVDRFYPDSQTREEIVAAAHREILSRLFVGGEEA